MSKIAEKPKDLFLLEGISVISFNKDFTKVALSKRDHLIYIYEITDFQKPDKWKLLNTLNMHILYISGLDWHPLTDKILSCSHDKTSYVWSYENNEWQFENVVVTTNLGFLSCSWDKKGNKFCECTGNKVIIGYFNKTSKWWMGIPLKYKEKKKEEGNTEKKGDENTEKKGDENTTGEKKGGGNSTATVAKIDPSSLYCISGYTNAGVKITSCYIKDVDDESGGEINDFGVVLYKFKMNGWILNVNWSDNGIGFASSQDSTIAIIDFKNQKHDLIRCTHSPVTKIYPVSDNEFYSVSYDRKIRLYSKDDNWKVKKDVTEKKKEKMALEKVEAPVFRTGAVADALKIFNQSGLKKKESIKVDKNDNINPAVITGFAINGNKIISVDMAGFIKLWNK